MAELKYADPQRLSHAYIISSDAPDAGLKAARNIATAAVCSGSGKRPCGVCRDCRKVLADAHPDLITLHRLTDDKGREKRNYVVDQIRLLIADAYVMPNEAAGKAYIIPEADTMNGESQNAALKLLEEPPQGVVLLLCTANPQMLLPTVRSRCVEICVNSASSAGKKDENEPAREFIRIVASGDRVKLFSWCAANDSMDTRAAAEFIDSAYSLTAEMLCKREKAHGMTGGELAALNSLLGKCAAYLKVNTGVKHIFGLLAVQAISKAMEERIRN